MGKRREGHKTVKRAVRAAHEVLPYVEPLAAILQPFSDLDASVWVSPKRKLAFVQASHRLSDVQEEVRRLLPVLEANGELPSIGLPWVKAASTVCSRRLAALTPLSELPVIPDDALGWIAKIASACVAAQSSPLGSLELRSNEVIADDCEVLPGNLLPEMAKIAFTEDGGSGVDHGLAIPVDAFNQVIWRDPSVAPALSPQTQILASGLVSGAAPAGASWSSAVVTPVQVARMAVGMGSGWLSGAVLGKGLGLLMNLNPQTQQMLRSTGMWAGAVQAFVNNAFPQGR